MHPVWRVRGEGCLAANKLIHIIILNIILLYNIIMALIQHSVFYAYASLNWLLMLYELLILAVVTILEIVQMQPRHSMKYHIITHSILHGVDWTEICRWVFRKPASCVIKLKLPNKPDRNSYNKLTCNLSSFL